MSLTRKLLKSMGIEEEKIEQIIDAHAETVSALKDEAYDLRDKAERLSKVEKELNDLKESNKNKNSENNKYKEKYEAIKSEYDGYRSEIEKKASIQAKETAYSKLLRENGIPDKRIKSIIKVSDIESIEINNDGVIENAEELSENIKNEWADFIVSSQIKGANVSQPNVTGKITSREAYEAMSLADKMKFANEHPKEAQAFMD